METSYRPTKKLTSPPSTDLASPDTQSDEDNRARLFIPPRAEQPMTRSQSAQDEPSESTVQTREQSATTPACSYTRNDEQVTGRNLIDIVTT